MGSAESDGSESAASDRDLRELHELILRSVNDGIHVIDRSGMVLVENAASARMLGWCGDCLVGKPGHATIHHHYPDGRDFPAHECPIYATSQDGVIRHVSDDVFWRQDGSSFPVEYSTAPLRDPCGDIVGVTVVFRDISERKRAERLQAALHAISNATHDSEDLDDLYGRVHAIIAGLLPAGNFHVAIYEADRNEVRFPYFVDAREATPPPGPIERHPAIATIIRTGQGQLLSENQAAARAGEHLQAATGDTTQWLGIPLVSNRVAVGALVVRSYSGQDRYTDDDRTLLEFVSAHVALAFERKRNHEQIRRMAQYDALTDLPNRGLFDDRLRMAFARVRRNHQGLALVYVDLDKFKPVNDTYGHTIGDLLLRRVAERLRACLRASDTVARVGGDEFVALLYPVDSPQTAALIAEKLRSALCQPFDLDGTTVQISCSIGIALTDGAAGDEHELTRRADTAMYQAKHGGRDRVVIDATAAHATPVHDTPA